jgi:Zn finger protein HypA/HybF involved in hydrogenase expression
LEHFKSQSQTGHAHALARHGDTWNFGSGLQAITPVVRVTPDLYKELGLTKYTRTNREAITPGHSNRDGVPYKVYDPGAQILRCFQCHSTGPLALTEKEGIQPFEMGVKCETCHGPGGDHARAPARTNIQNPTRLYNAAGINQFCGNCHRQPPAPGEDTDFSNTWNARHQPVAFSQSACFRKSNGKLTCLTCHDPHGAQPVKQDACTACHSAPRHLRPVAKTQTCSSCHMPLVRPSPDLQFANHWIGIYAPGQPLLPK